jgi:hypothetical protein
MHLTLPTFLLIATAIFLTPFARGEGEEVQPVQIRMVLHDPVNPIASLYYQDKAGAVLPVKFRPHDLTEAMLMMPLDGSLVLHNKAEIDPKNPQATVTAIAKLSPEIRRAIVVVLPAPKDSVTAYRMVIIDDSEKLFPYGESRVLSLVDLNLGIQAGEHMAVVQPWTLGSIASVKRVNEYNMAQTNFHYQQKNGSSVVFAERQLQYNDVCRRIFIIHATPRALQPTVTTIVDTRTGG